VSGRVGWVGATIMVLAVFVILGLVAEAFVPAPQGPALSSLATTPQGVAAWASLLQRAGHPVSQLGTPIAQAKLRPGTTLVVLDASPLSAADGANLTRFVRSGGRLVIGGPGVPHVTAPGVVRLASTVPVQNRNLATGDNAELALRLVGSTDRPVLFAEAIHGYGPATGVAAFPSRWWVAIALLALAAGAFVLSRWRRLGGPDPLPSHTSSPRSAYLDAMAATVSSTAGRDRLAELARRNTVAPPGRSRV
jgi:hypothetical protein